MPLPKFGIRPMFNLKIKSLRFVFPVLIIGTEAGLTGRAADLSSRDVVVMEQMIVGATQVDAHPGLLGKRDIWLYVAVPDCEILSRCDPEQTLAVARHIGDSLALNKGFVPDEYLAPLPIPMSFVMFNNKPTRAMEGIVPSSSEWTPSTANFGSYFPRTESLEGGINTEDSDTHCSVQNRGEGARWLWAGGGSRGPIPMGSMFQLTRCVPALPLWYRYGLDGPSGVLRMVGLDGGMIVATASWISEADTVSLLATAKKTNALPALPPIEGLFNVEASADRNLPAMRPSPAWMAEAALFMRWGLFGDPENKNHHSSFSTFVERSRTERVNEAMFHKCFGFGYAEMQTRLSRYLIDAASEAVCVDYQSIAHWSRHPNPDSPPFPNLDVREATATEVARLLGDWERMQGDDLRESNPALSRVYLEQAGKTLHKNYQKGDRDPRLLAVLGLYDCDVGATVEARGILIEATEAKVTRPAAYVALARLNLEDAWGHPGGATDERLNAQQTADVLKPLFAARNQARLDVEGYLLIAKVWTRSTQKPALPNLAVLKEGIRFYPFNSDLILATAKAFISWGYKTEADAFISQRLQFANAETVRQLLDLQGSLKKTK
jgi:hypothetical protein